MCPDRVRPPYFIRSIHVNDFAELVVRAAASRESWARDAEGPDRIEFGAFAAASLACRETILSGDELGGLSRNRLDSTQSPPRTTALSAWQEDGAEEAGRHFAREPQR